MKTFTDQSKQAPQSRANAHHVAQQKPNHGVLEESRDAVFEDNRPEAIAQRERQVMVDENPLLTAQRQQELLTSSLMEVQRTRQEALTNSPFMAAQRQQAEQWYGGAAQARLSEGEAAIQGDAEPVQKVENKTGLPDTLKAGIEALSGLSMDDVQVHKNSSKPADLQALAYTQGTEIHVAPGQEKHLPHEAWHAAQQKQGRVQPTMQAHGVSINDDTALEHEADVMGTKAMQMRRQEQAATGSAAHGVDRAEPGGRSASLRDGLAKLPPPDDLEVSSAPHVQAHVVAATEGIRPANQSHSRYEAIQRQSHGTQAAPRSMWTEPTRAVPQPDTASNLTPIQRFYTALQATDGTQHQLTPHGIAEIQRILDTVFAHKPISQADFQLIKRHSTFLEPRELQQINSLRPTAADGSTARALGHDIAGIRTGVPALGQVVAGTAYVGDWMGTSSTTGQAHPGTYPKGEESQQKGLGLDVSQAGYVTAPINVIKSAQALRELSSNLLVVVGTQQAISELQTFERTYPELAGRIRNLEKTRNESIKGGVGAIVNLGQGITGVINGVATVTKAAELGSRTFAVAYGVDAIRGALDVIRGIYQVQRQYRHSAETKVLIDQCDQLAYEVHQRMGELRYGLMNRRIDPAYALPELYQREGEVNSIMTLTATLDSILQGQTHRMFQAGGKAAVGGLSAGVGGLLAVSTIAGLGVVAVTPIGWALGAALILGSICYTVGKWSIARGHKQIVHRMQLEQDAINEFLSMGTVNRHPILLSDQWNRSIPSTPSTRLTTTWRREWFEQIDRSWWEKWSSSTDYRPISVAARLDQIEAYILKHTPGALGNQALDGMVAVLRRAVDASQEYQVPLQDGQQAMISLYTLINPYLPHHYGSRTWGIIHGLLAGDPQTRKSVIAKLKLR